VILVNGGLTFYVERGGKTLLTYSDDLARLTSAASALAEMIDRGRMPKIHFSKINALPALSQRSPTFAQPAERHRSTHYGQQVSQ
jgi:ATP-dependent Lhr-like helicase